MSDKVYFKAQVESGNKLDVLVDDTAKNTKVFKVYEIRDCGATTKSVYLEEEKALCVIRKFLSENYPLIYNE